MVTADLTTPMMEGGQQLLTLLDQAGFPVRACFWFYFPESDRWRFVVASPEVRARGPRAAYRKIQAIARKVPGGADLFAPGDVTAVKDNDPLVELLRTAVSKGSGVSGIRLTGNSVNGTFIDDAYIYRVS